MRVAKKEAWPHTVVGILCVNVNDIHLAKHVKHNNYGPAIIYSLYFSISYYNFSSSAILFFTITKEDRQERQQQQQL